MRKIDEIIVHCSATQPDWYQGRPITEKVEEIRRWHKDQGWNDIGYHLIIDRDGVTAQGRPIAQVGAHVKNHNANSIGICLIGGAGSASTDRASEHFTPAQLDTLSMTLKSLQARYPTITKVSGHNEYAAKACPGFNVPRWLNNRPQRANIAESTTIQATAATALAGAGGTITAIGALDGKAQIILLACAAIALLSLGWIARERIRRWAAGER